MIESCTFEQFNIKLLDFKSMFHSIEIDLINDLSKYELLTAKKITRDIKKLIYHHIFLGICEQLHKARSKERLVILKHQEDFNYSKHLIHYFDNNDIIKYTEQAVKQVCKLLPINIYCYKNFIFSNISEAYNNRNGDAIELMQHITTFSWSREFLKSHFTFAKVKVFAKRNNLTFLSEQYFNQLKTKQLLFI